MESAHKFQIVDLFNERIKQEEDNLKNELDNLIGKEENISKPVRTAGDDLSCGFACNGIVE